MMKHVLIAKPNVYMEPQISPPRKNHHGEEEDKYSTAALIQDS